MKIKFPFGEKEIKIFKESLKAQNPGVEFQTRMYYEVYKEWIKNKIIPKETTWKMFTDAAYMFARRRNIWDDRHTFKYIAELDFLKRPSKYIYPWGERTEKIFKSSKSGWELQTKLKELFDEWKRNKVISESIPWRKFTEAAYCFAARNDILEKYHTFRPVPITDPTEYALSYAEKFATMREESMAARRLEMLFGDLKKIPRVSIPKTTGERPLNIEASKDGATSMLVINSPLVGTLASTDEADDIFKNAIRTANLFNVDGILITGNLLYCLVERYGKQRPYQTQVIGVEPDAELLKEAYPPAVLKKIGPITERIDKNKIVFMTIKIYLDSLFKAVKKKFLDENGKPIFKGDVFVVLGEMEESIAMYYANEALRTEVYKEKSFAHKQIRELRVDLKNARRSNDRERETEIVEEIRDWEVYDKLLVLMGNITPATINDRKQQMINYLAYQIGNHIPNGRVVGVGDVYLKVGNELIATTNDKTVDSIRGGLAGRLRKGIYSYIKGHKGERVPHVILGSGMNPWGTGLFASFRIKEKKSTLDDVRMTEAIQLLPCIDSNLYRETVRRMLKVKGSRVAKLANITNFESGLTILKFFEPGPFTKVEWYKSDFLTNREIFAVQDKFAETYKKDPRSKIIYIKKEGCNHLGANGVSKYESPDDKDGRYIKYHNQVMFESLVKSKAPIHLYLNDGDILQWLNFPTYKENAAKWKDQEEMLAEFTDIERDKDLTANEKLRLVKTRSLENMLLSGITQPEDQIDAWGRAYAPYADFFKMVIETARKSRIVVDGHLGIISIGQGNHNENTFRKGDIRFSEARLISKEIYTFLLEKGYKPKGLRDYIKACQVGGVGLAHGILRVASLGRNAYEYCVFMKHKSGPSSKAEDNMRGMIATFSVRGSTDDYEEGRFTLNFGGDDHMGGHAMTKNAFHVKTGGQMFSGPFGFKLDFPKQNLFSAICGVPAGGPAWGPFSIIAFGFREVRKLAVYKVELPKELFNNPI